MGASTAIPCSPLRPCGSRRCQVRYLQALVGLFACRTTCGLADGACRSRWLAVEVQDLLNWRESSLEVDAVDLDAVLTKPAVEGIL